MKRESRSSLSCRRSALSISAGRAASGPNRLKEQLKTKRRRSDLQRPTLRGPLKEFKVGSEIDANGRDCSKVAMMSKVYECFHSLYGEWVRVIERNEIPFSHLSRVLPKNRERSRLQTTTYKQRFAYKRNRGRLKMDGLYLNAGSQPTNMDRRESPRFSWG